MGGLGLLLIGALVDGAAQPRSERLTEDGPRRRLELVVRVSSDYIPAPSGWAAEARRATREGLDRFRRRAALGDEAADGGAGP